MPAPECATFSRAGSKVRAESVTSELLIRKAEPADLPEVYEVQYEATLGDQLMPPPGTGVLSKFRHELAEANALVAVFDGRILGFGAVFERAHVAFLATLHVRPSAQAADMRVGRRLLEQLFPSGVWSRAVVSSRLPRAVALYTRFGMPPQWPLYMLEVESGRLRPTPPTSVRVVVAEQGDPELLDLDARIAGRGPRAADHAYWVRERAGEPFWLERGTHRIGYGYAQHLYRSSDAAWGRQHLMLGPLGVLDARDAVDAVSAAVGWAAPQARILALDVSGPHPALKTLFDLGFQFTYNATFGFANGHTIYDPTRYIVSDTITL